MKQYFVGKRMIGTYDNGVFFKEVMESKHLMRVIDSWGVDARTLNSLPDETLIKIHDIEHDKVYLASKGQFLKHRSYLHFKSDNKDHKTQIFLPRMYFTVEEPKQLTQEQKDENDYRLSQGLTPRWI